MARFKLHGAEKGKTLPASGQRGPLQVWMYDLEDADGNRLKAEALKKPDNEPPIGEHIDGKVTDSDFGPKFKADPPPRDGRNGRSPEDRLSIVRQHSAEMALRYAAIRQAQGKLPDDFTLDDLRAIIDWFVEDAG